MHLPCIFMQLPMISCATLKESIARHTTKDWHHIHCSYLPIQLDISARAKHYAKEEFL